MAGALSRMITDLRDRLLGDTAARQLAGVAVLIVVAILGFVAALFVGLKWGLIGEAVVLGAALVVLLWRG